VQKVGDKILELAEIKPGERVLDIATGIGELAVTAARTVSQMAKLLLQTFLLKCWQLQREEPITWFGQHNRF
jgi:protein-L-isoaspartate O-methyltransferase